jgi:hypothetical protein
MPVVVCAIAASGSAATVKANINLFMTISFSVHQKIDVALAETCGGGAFAQMGIAELRHEELARRVTNETSNKTIRLVFEARLSAAQPALSTFVAGDGWPK